MENENTLQQVKYKYYFKKLLLIMQSHMSLLDYDVKCISCCRKEVQQDLCNHKKLLSSQIVKIA